MTTFNTRVTFDHVRNSAAGFTSSNPVLGYGVTGLETDTGRIKVGDGVTPWNSLLYSTSVGLVEVNGFTAQSLVISGGSNVTVSSSQGQVTIDAAGGDAVQSVNAKAGVVVLNSTDVSAASAVHTHVALDITDFAAEAAKYGPVSSVNAKTGVVTIVASDVGAASAAHTHVALDVTDFATEAAKYGPVSSVAGKTGVVTLATGDLTDFDPDAYGKVSSVNGLTGTVTLVAASVSAASAVHSHVAADVTDFATAAALYGPVSSVGTLTGAVSIVAGDGITVTTSGSSITIAGNTASGGGSASAPVTVSVSTVTATQNDWNLGDGDIYYLYSGITNTINITGIATATGGSQRLLVNESTHTSASFTIKHQDTNSTATQRLVVPWAGDYVLSPNGGAAVIIRNADGDRWRVV